MSAPVVVVVDDDTLVLRAVVRFLTGFGVPAQGVSSGPLALELLGSGIAVRALVADLEMPGMHGYELIAAVRARHPTLPIVAMTGYLAEEHGERAVELGARVCLAKPLEPRALLEAVETASRAAGPLPPEEG